ncbi:MAG: protein translocase subunit SecD [Gemmatimonadales bacterium]
MGQTGYLVKLVNFNEINMFDSLITRFVTIGILIVVSIASLWPREVTAHKQLPDGTTIDTVWRERQPKLGLDLQGGIHLALELDESGGPVPNKSDAIDRALKVIRTRIDEFGVAEPLIQREGSSRIVVELAGLDDPQRAKDIVKKSAFLEFQMTDEDGLFRAALPAIDRALAAAGVTEASVGRQIAESTGTANRAAQAPNAAPAAAVQDLLSGARTDTAKGQAKSPARGARRDTARSRADTARSDTLGNQLNGTLSSLLFSGGSMPGAYMVAEEKVRIVTAMLNHPAALHAMPRNIVWRLGADRISRGARSFYPLYALQERDIMTGEGLIDAQARLDPVYNQAVVEFQLSRRAGRIFENWTGQHVGKYMAIVLDKRVQSQPPVIKGQIGQRGQIELGSASLQDAQDLALVLKAGALPAPLQIVDERIVEAGLGADSIRKSIVAGIVGVMLVVVIMIGYYRLAGILSIVALALYVLFTAGGLAAMGATLTLPGMAGFVLSIGIAVDANVLIFERIREELVHGKSVRLAIDAGFKMAMNAIVDSNVSTMLTAAFLFQFGTGPVKGFAVTLILGILASMVTAIFVTRTFFMVYLARKQQLQTLSI